MAVARRLARFHLLNGTVSLFGNLAIMTVLCGMLRIDPVAANVVAIGVCSMLNFVASEVLVFKSTTVTVAGMLVMSGMVGPLAPSTANAAEMATAELTAAAIAAWEQVLASGRRPIRASDSGRPVLRAGCVQAGSRVARTGHQRTSVDGPDRIVRAGRTGAVGS